MGKNEKQAQEKTGSLVAASSSLVTHQLTRQLRSFRQTTPVRTFLDSCSRSRISLRIVSQHILCFEGGPATDPQEANCFSIFKHSQASDETIHLPGGRAP